MGGAGGAGATEVVRVRVGEERSAVDVRGVGLEWGTEGVEGVEDGGAPSDAGGPGEGSAAGFTPVERGEARVTLAGGRLRLDGRPVDADAVRFRARPVEGTEGTEGLSAQGLRLRGELIVLRGLRGLVVVNVVDLEDYLAGVLGSEMPRSYPLEALKAQAVAARTYALNKKIELFGADAHLGSSVISQVYRGLEAEDARTREAVAATRGVVLTHELQPIEAYFHASCGGRTELGAEALGRPLPYLRTVRCPCASLRESRWTLRVPRGELADRMGLAPAAAGRLAVAERTASGRVRRLRAGVTSVDAVPLRARMGYARLRSLDFELSWDGATAVFSGRGFGHGAGLCQWGARLRAEQGWSYERILAEYYPGTELQPLY